MQIAMLTYLPDAPVLHLGLFRKRYLYFVASCRLFLTSIEQISLQPVEYYNKLPAEPHVDMCIVLEPMVATSGTAKAAINILKDWGVRKIKLICICASRPGLIAFTSAHPDVDVYVGVIDEILDSEG